MFATRSAATRPARSSPPRRSASRSTAPIGPFLRAIGIALGARHDFAELRDIFGGLAGTIPPDIALVIRTLVLLNGLSERLAPGERRIVRELVQGAAGALAAASA
jgi:hypothetical protein